MSHHVSRRSLVATGAALAATAAFATRLAAQDASPEGTGEWSFTDDEGVTVTLPQRPTRIAADLSAAAPLWDFGITPIAVSGWTVGTDAAWGNVDRGVPVINAQADAPEPDLEELLAAEAELFVTIAWGPGDVWSFSSPETYLATQSVVPVLAISVAGVANENLQRFAGLAVALGADLDSPELTAARETYETSIANFTETVATKSDLTAIFATVGVEGDTWNVANPPDWADLSWYGELGLSIIKPDVADGDFWLQASREEGGILPADVFFQSTRAGRMTAEELQADPIFGTRPDIAAGQIGAWNQDFILSYQGLTAALDSMSKTLSTAEKVTD